MQPSRFGIPRVAWIISLIAIAIAAGLLVAATPIPLEKCLVKKTCAPSSGDSWLIALGVLVLGAATATIAGQIPRHWLASYNVATAGLAVVILYVVPMGIVSLRVAPDPLVGWVPHLVYLAIIACLPFVLVFAAQYTASLLASAFARPTPDLDDLDDPPPTHSANPRGGDQPNFPVM